jgi:hypothetical protein
LITSYSAQKLSNRRGLLSILKFVAAVAALTVMPMSASAQIDAETSRIHITLLKADVFGFRFAIFDKLTSVHHVPVSIGNTRFLLGVIGAD